MLGFVGLGNGSHKHENNVEARVTIAHCGYPSCLLRKTNVLGGSGDLVSKVISTLIGVISSYKYSYLSYNPSY